MKKNYLAYLQQYQGKTSLMAKQDKYRKKFIKTVYNCDKQNHHPNVPLSSSHKKKNKGKLVKDNNKQGKGSSKKSKENSRQPTQQKEDIAETIKDMHFEQREKISSLTPSQFPFRVKSQAVDMNYQVSKLVQNIEKKYQQQVEKCKMYYAWLREEIDLQEDQTLNQVADIFELAKKEVKTISRLNENDENYMLKKKEHKTEVDLELVQIVFDEGVRTQLSEKIRQLSIFNLNNLLYSSQNSTKNHMAFRQEQELKEKVLEEERSWFEGDSFALKDERFPLFYKGREEGEGVSPTFKQF